MTRSKFKEAAFGGRGGGLRLFWDEAHVPLHCRYFPVWMYGKLLRVPVKRIMRRGGGWTVSGERKSEIGTWRVEDRLTPRGNTLVIDRRWRYRGGRIGSVRLGLDLFVPFAKPDFWAIPYISMNGNSGSRTVPVGMTLDGDPWVFREERTTAPGLMTLEAGGWVAGSYTQPGRSELTLCACSIVPGKNGHTLRTFFPYREGPKTFLGAAFPGRAEIQEQGLYTCPSASSILDVEDGARFRRKFYVVLDRVNERRHGYARVWESAWRNLREPPARPVPVKRTENLLWRALDKHYVHKGKVAGFAGRVDCRGKPYGVFTIGWCVPTAMLTWLGLRRAIRARRPRLAEKVIRASEFYVANAGRKNGVFLTHYNLREGSWSERDLNAVQMGGGAYWLLKCVSLLRTTKLFERRVDPKKWADFALGFCDLAVRTQRRDGAFCAHWNRAGRAVGFERAMGIHSARAVLEAHRLTGRSEYLRAAERGAEFYAREMIDREQGYGDCTDILNSTTENDGAFVPDFYIDLYRTTGDKRWLAKAVRAAEYCLSYMYTYNIYFPPDTECGKRRMRTRGFSAISPETAFVCFWFAVQGNAFLELWRETGEKRWKDYAVAVIRASLQMMTEPGDTFGLDEKLVGFRAEVIPVLDTIKDRRIWKKGMTGYTWDTPVMWPAVFNLLNFAVVEDGFPELMEEFK